MRVLVVGGTRFVGKHLVDELVARGHDVALFNRGRTRPAVFDNVAVYGALERIVGDRNADLSALSGREWDVVIDTCAYVPRQVHALLNVIDGCAALYTLISTVSVYADPQAPGTTEDAALLPPPSHLSTDPGPQQRDPTTYGALKAMCEEAARARLDEERCLIIRPGFVVGPEDYTWRFPYWVDRIAGGGEVLAPAPQTNPLQVLDARDLAAFLVRRIEIRAWGTCHVAGPATPATFESVLATMNAVSDAGAQPVWVDQLWLAQRGVEPSMLPLAIGPDDPVDVMRLDVGRALASGLSLRPIGDTVADTLAWLRATQATRPSGVGLAPERERALLNAWRGESRQER